jgi:hypothetical protein
MFCHCAFLVDISPCGHYSTYTVVVTYHVLYIIGFIQSSRFIVSPSIGKCELSVCGGLFAETVIVLLQLITEQLKRALTC